jgi:uncharacterized membrane protein
VAIAISLVPPLTNAGILFAAREPDLAVGSLLLFMTNYFAILITGTLVFGLMGYPGASLVPKSLRGRRVGVAVIVAMVIIIAIPLGISSRGVARDTAAENHVAEATKTWLEGSGYRYVSATARDRVVSVVITGQGELPPMQQLESSLDGQIYGMAVRLDTVPSERVEFDTVSDKD